MKNTYVIIDLANLFFRARYVTRGELDDKIGMSIHTVLSSIRKAWREFNGTHVVVATEGRSWRKDVYAPYKRQRADARAALTPKEVEEERAFWESYDEFKAFITDKTNCTVLHNPILEADDLIAGWTRTHPNDTNVIISTDGDFAQLVDDHVILYNGVTGVTTTLEGYFDINKQRVVDTKTKEIKPPLDPEWLLFEKCIRGDVSDNIFSAFPGVRKKGTKNKVGLIDAFEDRHSKGYNWCNLMMQQWTDHEGVQHKVQDDYERNKLLCDLNAQPAHIKEAIDATINSHVTANKNVSQVGVRLMKFCSTYDLVKITEQITSYADPLNARYSPL